MTQLDWEKPDFDLIAWIKQTMEISFQKEVQKRFDEMLYGTRSGAVSELFRGAENSFKNIDKPHEGFTSVLNVYDEWSSLGRSNRFTPAEFNQMWDSFSEERKLEYVKSLMDGEV
jgi:hypothetical protein